jgi:hypothetical protein
MFAARLETNRGRIGDREGHDFNQPCRASGFWVEQRFSAALQTAETNPGFSPLRIAHLETPQIPTPPWKSGASTPRQGLDYEQGFSPRIPVSRPIGAGNPRLSTVVAVTKAVALKLTLEAAP